jgi:hypothetical protein
MQLTKGPNMNAYISMNVFFSGLTAFLSIYLSGLLIKTFSTLTLHIHHININAYQILLLGSGLFHLLAIIFFLMTMTELPRKFFKKRGKEDE